MFSNICSFQLIILIFLFNINFFNPYCEQTIFELMHQLLHNVLFAIENYIYP